MSLRSAILGLLCAILVSTGCGEGALSSSSPRGDGSTSPDGVVDPQRPGQGNPNSANGDDPDDRPDGLDPATPGILIESPENGALLSRQRVLVSGLASQLDEIELNGESVDVVDGRWEHHLFLDEGSNPIEAHADETVVDTIEVMVDITPPQVTIESPERGTFGIMALTDFIHVNGQASDAYSDVVAVTVNGIPTALGADGLFELDYEAELGTNLIEVEAEDAAGNISHDTRAVLHGNYHPRAVMTPHALAAFFRADGFDVIEEIAVGLITEQVQDAVAGAAGSGSVEIERFTFSRVELDLVPQNGYIAANIKMYDMRVDVEVEFEIDLLFDEIDVTVDGNVRANPAEVSARIIPTLSPDGVIGIEFAGGDVSLHSFRFDISGIPGFIESLLDGLVRDIAEDVLNDALEDFALNDLFDPATLLRSIDLLGTTLEFDFVVTAIPITPQGITMLSHAAVYNSAAEERGPGPFIWPGGLSDVSADRVLNLAFAYNLINRLFYTMWESGGLDIDLAELMGDGGADAVPLPLDTTAFSLLVGDELLTRYGSGVPIQMALRPLLPPVAEPFFHATEPGVMRLEIGDMLIDFSVELDDGSSETWATVAMYADMIIDLAWEDGGLVPTIELVSVLDVYEEPIFDLDDVALEQTLEDLMVLLPGLVAGSLDEFGLSEFEGIGIEGMLFRSLEKSPYLVVGADIVPVLE